MAQSFFRRSFLAVAGLAAATFFVAPSAEAAETVEVTIEATDQMSFSMKEIEVPAGATVKLTLEHVGKMAATAMGHNWVLLAKDMPKEKFAKVAMTAKKDDYIPKKLSKKVIAHTKLLGGGESDTITFEAPEKGSYTFICSFPGHYAMMNGTFVVK